MGKGLPTSNKELIQWEILGIVGHERRRIPVTIPRIVGVIMRRMGDLSINKGMSSQKSRMKLRKTMRYTTENMPVVRPINNALI